MIRCHRVIKVQRLLDKNMTIPTQPEVHPAGSVVGKIKTSYLLRLRKRNGRSECVSHVDPITTRGGGSEDFVIIRLDRKG